MSQSKSLGDNPGKAAEPMDLSDGSLIGRASNWLFDGHFQPGPSDPDVQSLTRIFRAIRDAATAAERLKIRELLCKQCQLKVPDA